MKTKKPEPVKIHICECDDHVKWPLPTKIGMGWPDICAVLILVFLLGLAISWVLDVLPNI